MINKELLHLPGANLAGSLLLGLLQTIGALAEILVMVVSVFALGSLWDLPVPGILASLVDGSVHLGLTLAVLILVRGLCLMVSNRLSTTMAISMDTALSQDLYLSMFDDRPRYREGSGSNQSLAMLSTEGVKRVASYFTDFLPMLFQAVLMIPVVLLVLLPVSPAAAVTILCGMLIMPMTMRIGSRRNAKVQTEHLRKYDKVGVHFEESLRGLDTLKIFHADQAEADRLAEDSEGFRKQTMAVLGGQLRSLINADMVVHLTVILAAVLTILVHGSQPRTWLLPAILVVAIGSRLFAAEHRLTYLAHSAVVAIRQGKAIAAVRQARLEEGKEGADGSAPAAPIPASADDSVRITRGGVAARGLEFSYPDGYKALNALTFDLPEHGHIGIVGASGSGKSTLASILCGQLQGYQGSLSIQGRELRDLSMESLIGAETVVRGTDHIFAGTVRTNLDPAGVGYGEEDLRRALEDVDLIDLLDRPGGLDAPVEQAGANLSGGQRQRLSIARGLLRGSAIYVFDEATSAVDREHDADLARLMDELGRRALVITITHRLAGVRKADRILLLDGGSLVEGGTFDELMAAKGLFAAQWNEQERYEDLEVEQ